MTTALKSLTFTTLPKSTVNPTLDRRTKIITRLEEQKALLRDPGYMRVVHAWGKNETGDKVMVDKKQRVLPWWSVQPNGSCAFFVRAGWKPVEFEKGKAAIAVASLDKCRQSSTRSLPPFEPGNSTSSWHMLARKQRQRRRRENSAPAAGRFEERLRSLLFVWASIVALPDPAPTRAITLKPACD